MSKKPGITLEVKLRTNGHIEIWLDERRPATEVAAMLRDIAKGLENNPRQVG